MIVILAAPSHGNRGDHMIVFGMRKFCEKYFPGYRLEEFDDSIVKQRSFLSLLKIALRKNDLVFLRGGGSVGDWYIHYEYFIRHLLERFAKYRIVMFPQSVISNTPQGNLERPTAHAYDAHPRFLINTRDDKSLRRQGNASHAKVRLCPDIAMLPPSSVARMRETACCCAFGRQERNVLYLAQRDADSHPATIEIKYGDTAGMTSPLPTGRPKSRNAGADIVEPRIGVDRFHGVIASVSPTSCAAFGHHAITAGIKWLVDLTMCFCAGYRRCPCACRTGDAMRNMRCA